MNELKKYISYYSLVLSIMSSMKMIIKKEDKLLRKLLVIWL